MQKTAITPSRSDNFSAWYSNVVREADLAVSSPVRGCMIIRPNGYGIWERIQYLLNKRILDTGHENLYFPLFIPLSFIAKEAQHVDGFAKEMAIVTHHRLSLHGTDLVPDPTSELSEPLIVRPTSETIIGHHFRENIQSWRDLPLLWNQWANVVRWEMRPRLFLRTAEFLWQEGHTAHVDGPNAMAETMQMLEVYRAFAEEVLAMPVVAGEKSAHERFPGAERTFSIEAMMWDGKALQAGTSHYLGTHFAQAQDIRYQTKAGELSYCHTTSWGASTRLIGGVIMTHGDDDGMRIPPRIAPRQIVIVPILRNDVADTQVLDFCERFANELRAKAYAGEALRVLVDRREERSVDKRWGWIKRGAPVVCEIGLKDISSGNSIKFFRRDKLRSSGKVEFHTQDRDVFIENIELLLSDIHNCLWAEAAMRMNENIICDIDTADGLYEYFKNEDGHAANRAAIGWVRASWKKKKINEMHQIENILKDLGLTIRNAPLDQSALGKRCIFTGDRPDEEILIARSY